MGWLRRRRQPSSCHRQRRQQRREARSSVTSHRWSSVQSMARALGGGGHGRPPCALVHRDRPRAWEGVSGVAPRALPPAPIGYRGRWLPGRLHTCGGWPARTGPVASATPPRWPRRGRQARGPPCAPCAAVRRAARARSALRARSARSAAGRTALCTTRGALCTTLCTTLVHYASTPGSHRSPRSSSERPASHASALIATAHPRAALLRRR